MAETYLGNPTITAKDIYSRDATALLSKNILQYPAHKYADAQKQMAPQNPLWWMHTLVLSRMSLEMHEWVRPFIKYDNKFFLRGGAVHTEMGHIYPVAVKDSDIPKPGENLVTQRGEYLRIIQEESGKDPIYLRTVIDQRKFDHAERFYSFEDYAAVMQYYVTTLSRATNLFFNSLIAGMFIGMTGGAVMFDEGTQLERFFQPSGKDITPTEAFSKMAREYYSNTGEVKKHIKREIGRMVMNMKNRAVYDPSLIIDEVNAQSQEIKEYNFPDISDENKIKKWLKSMYLKSQGGKTMTHEHSRRRCIWGLLKAISFKLTRMTTVDSVYNWMAYDTERTGDLSDKYDMSMLMRPGDAMVFMNSEDLEDARQVRGGLAIGMFSDVKEGTVARWEEKGVKFYGVPFMLPGTFLILPRQALSVIVYFDETYQEQYKYHLVGNWIKHTMCKVVAFRNFPAHFGSMKIFQPDSNWLVKHHKWFKDAN